METDSTGVPAARCPARTSMKRRPPHVPDIQRLLALYRFCGATAMVSFAACVSLLGAVLYRSEVSYVLLGMGLLAGFLWIGSTSVCRHSLIKLKDNLGQEVGMPEFLSTQFVFFLFPYAYRKLKKEVNRYTEKF
jgi:hypothetical protein